MTSNDQNRSDEAMISRLLRKAGRGPTAPDDARLRVYNTVQAEWRRSVSGLSGQQSREEASRSSRDQWSRRWLVRSVPFAAAVATAAVVFFVIRTTPVPEQRAELAAATKVLGTVELIEPGLSQPTLLSAESRPLHAGDGLRTGRDGAASLTLRNGISLRIDAGSELVLASTDSVDLRSGTIYLDTGGPEESSAPLEIATPLGVVWHRGTQYEVRVADQRLRVRVREGAVGVREDDAEYTGSAGEQLLLGRDDALNRTAISTSGPDWAWVERLASAPPADQLQVLDLLEWVARETGRELQFANEAIAQVAQADTIYGITGLTPAETLEVIEGTTALSYEATDEALLIF